MEASIYLALFLLFLSSISIPLLLTIFFHKTKSQQYPNLPPALPWLPFVGETLSYLSTGWNGHPEKFVLDHVRNLNSKVFRTHLLGHPAAVLSGSSGNKFLFSNEDKLVRVWLPDSVNKIFPFAKSPLVGEESRRMRKLLPQFMKPESLRSYVAIMDDVATRHFDSLWVGQQVVQVLPLAENLTFWVACRLFLSLDDPHRISEFKVPFNGVMSGIFGMPLDFPGTAFRKAIKASRFIREEYLTGIIRKRKAELADDKDSHSGKTTDILSFMLTAVDDSGEYMSEMDISDKIFGLLVGSHDTASSTFTFVVKFLAELPEIYDRVYQEQMEIARSKAEGERLNWDDIQKMKYSWNVACEALRLVPPAPGAFREATQDFIFNGFTILKGWKLFWSAAATHKTVEYFPDPEKFDPSRFEGSGPAPYTFIPFGGGPRMCPGKEYARIEILVFIHNLVKRFKFKKLIPNEKIVASPIAVPAKGLPIHLYPH